MVLAALALRAAVRRGLHFRGGAAPAGPWRDDVTLTKPRIMSLLLLTGACGMVAERTAPGGDARSAMLGLGLACGGRRAQWLLDNTSAG